MGDLAIKNNATAIAIILTIVISGFSFLMPAYSQIPYLPKIQSSSEKNENSTIINANKSNNDNS